MKKLLIVFLFIFCSFSIFAQNAANGENLPASAQLRSFRNIFPHASQAVIDSSFSDSGYVKTSNKKTGFSILGSESGSGINPLVVSNVLNKNPGYLVESIAVINVNPESVRLLDIYNALGNIRGLKGRLYRSSTRGRSVPLFEDATRITSERNTSAISDPPSSRTLPGSETVYIKLKDVNFGNTYYRADMTLIQNGIRYTLTNFRSMSYLVVPGIGEGKFTAQLYIEPIQEGVLIYSIAGMDISDFFASQLHVESAISKRLAVIIAWAAEGIAARR